MPAFDSEATLVSPSSNSERTLVDPRPEPSDPWGSAGYRAPQQFAPPAPAARRRVWPWVIAIVALLLVTVTGLGIAAAIVIPRIIAQQNENRGNSGVNEPVTNSNNNSNTKTSANANSSTNSNSNLNSNTNTNDNSTANNNSKSNSNTNANALNPPPTDVDLVLSQLSDLEQDWTVANINADKKKLAQILADDYVGTSDGRMQGKSDYLRDIKPDPSVKHWDFDKLKLSLNGDRATLKGRITLQINGRDEDLMLDFVDKFVWRDGRWQAVSSEVSGVK